MKLGTWKARDIEAKRLGEIVKVEEARETRNIEAKKLGEIVEETLKPRRLGEIVEAKRQETLKARGLEKISEAENFREIERSEAKRYRDI